MPAVDDDDRPGLIFRSGGHVWLRRVMRFLLVALVLTFAGALLDGIKMTIAHHGFAMESSTLPESSVAARARAFAPFELAQLFGAALPPVIPQTVEPALLPTPTPTPAPEPAALPLHHWAGDTYSWSSFIAAFVDVVWSLLTTGSFDARMFALGEIILGTAVTFWVVSCVRALIVTLTKDRDAARLPRTYQERFVFVILVWPIGTIGFASIMAILAQWTLLAAASAFGIVHAAWADVAADFTVYGFSCAFAASAIELRIHALAEGGINAL